MSIILSKYDDFLSQNQLFFAINEAKLMASDAFLQRLEGIPDNLIANKLVQAFSSNQLIDKNLNYNWIDISDQDGVITFTSDRNAERLSNDASQIWTSRRQSYSVGKLARAILPEIGFRDFKDKDIEDFVNLYKASKVDTTKKFEIVEGAVIKDYYIESSYSEKTGSLSKSCMRYDECQNYFRIYSSNAPLCRLLVYFDDNQKVLGRAIIWKLAKAELYEDVDKPYQADIEYFMDRVYTTNESDVLKFIDFAKKNNWLVKYKMSANNEESLQFSHNGKWIFGRIIIELKRLYFEKYPYVDTVKFANGDNAISNVGFVVNLKDPEHDLGFTLNNTDGRITYCSDCNGSGIDRNQDTKCKKCKGKKETTCKECEGTKILLCNDCGGRGKEECSKCSAVGLVECEPCKGEGSVVCQNCEGRGAAKCQICNGNGDLGQCDECRKGKIFCKTCSNEPLACTECNGIGTLSDELGETVKCRECDGLGKASEGSNRATGCRCPECSIDKRGGKWKNQGFFFCQKCDGDGKLVCPMNCDNGYTDCTVCMGKGAFPCKECKKKGILKCPQCEGKKYTGPCKTCKGVGNLGACKCGTGKVPCESCNSTGIRGKLSETEYKCSSCAGLLDDFIVKRYPQKRIN